MNKLELLDKQNLIQESIKNLISKGESEVRKLNDEEGTELEGFKTELAGIKAQLEEIRKEDEQANKSNKTITINKRNMEQFNLIEVIRNEAERRSQSDANLEVLQAGTKSFSGTGLEYKGQIQLPLEYRAEIVAAGNPVVATDKLNLLEPLRAKLVAVQAGAQLITGLVGNVSIPTYSGSNASWVGETVVAVEGAGTFGEVTLGPKRLTTFIDVSKQFLAQDGINAQQILIDDLTTAISSKLEATIFGKAATVATIPDGFYTGIADGSLVVKGASTWAKVVALEANVDTSNALIGKIAYITNSTGKSFLKTSAKAANTAAFLLDGGEMNGYPVYVTNHMCNGLATAANEQGLLFGNFNDLIIGQWGAIDITVDPYTQATYGKIRLIVNAYFDVKKRRNASFAVGSILS